MGVYIPDGSTISIASTYGTAKSVSAITNASEAVATLEASHNVIVADILEATSGWSKLDGRIVRAKAVATNDVTLEGINTSSTTKYPAGSGTGSVREVTAWTQITQIMSFQGQGGETQFAKYAFLEDDRERQIPTVKSAEGFNFELADDSSLPWYSVLVAADEDRLPRALRLVLPSGDVIYYNTYVSFNATPVMNKGNVAVLRGSFSLIAAPTRYTS